MRSVYANLTYAGLDFETLEEMRCTGWLRPRLHIDCRFQHKRSRLRLCQASKRHSYHSPSAFADDTTRTQQHASLVFSSVKLDFSDSRHCHWALAQTMLLPLSRFLLQNKGRISRAEVALACGRSANLWLWRGICRADIGFFIFPASGEKETSFLLSRPPTFVRGEEQRS